MERKNHKRTDYLLIIIGCISLFYFVLLMMNMSFSTFLLIYPFFSLLCFCFAGVELYTKRKFQSLLPNVVKYFLMVCILLFFSSFIAAESVIIYQSINTYEQKSDFVLVLGAQVNGDSISASLKYRLEAALELYQKYPNNIFVVSGGKGTDENNTEAYYMERYLLEKGVPQTQIIKEEQSTNTYENVYYSKQIMDRFGEGEYDVTIVTNAFHTYRSKFLAEKVGLDAHTYSAKMHTISIPNFYIREYFGLMKDMVVNLKRS